MTLSAFHTHASFCHGANTAEEMVKKALSLGCPEIGFSCHSYMDVENDWCMTRDGTLKYKAEIERLKKEYSDRIKVYLGIEQDYFSPAFPEGYDYVIGSVHFVSKNGVLIPLDISAGDLKKAINELYDGDALALAEDYYETVSDVYNKTGCNIVGHIDLITKFEEKEKIFDTSSERYRRAALTAVDALMKKPVVFEINTGAISRGYRTSPYPEDFILDYIGEREGTFVISPDAHSTDTLLFGMKEAQELIKAKGYRYFLSMEEIVKK
ncbi:MAG: histidinol-phosphatase [Clostridia bacterium]|nr:histidinol-phosphatase [Clostridia bacterium]